MVELLFTALRYELVNVCTAKKDVEELVSTVPTLMLSTAVDWLLEYLNAECMIINIDEANALAEAELTEVLKCFGRELCLGKRVYITVTGIYKASVTAAIDFSGMIRRDVFLPPLLMEQSLAIFASLGLIPRNAIAEQLNPYFVHLVWLAGGVPRYLDYLTYSIARKALPDMGVSFLKRDISTIRAFITTMNHQDCISVLGTWKPLYEFLKRNEQPPDRALTSMKRPSPMAPRVKESFLLGSLSTRLCTRSCYTPRVPPRS